MKKLSPLGRISIFLVIACIITLWFFPMWRIDLAAPQYPEGIYMNIWINDLSGDVEIINGLNHCFSILLCAGFDCLLLEQEGRLLRMVRDLSSDGRVVHV